MGLWDFFKQKTTIAPSKPPFAIQKNRYPANILIPLWEQADRSKTNISLESNNPFFSIDITGIEKIDCVNLVQVLSYIDDFDAIVQDFCKESYDASSFDMKNYMVVLAWISIESECKIIMGYWGEYVNIELRAVFERKENLWKKVDLYFQ